MTNIEIIRMLVNALDTNGVSDEACKQGALALLDNLKVAPKPSMADAKPKQGNKETKRASVDHGKILALHEAGWSVAKIADEMGTTTVTVRNHIKKGGAV